MKCRLAQNLNNLETDSIFTSDWCKGKSWYISTNEGRSSIYMHSDGMFHHSTEYKGYYKCPIMAISTFAKYRPDDELDISAAIIPQTVEEWQKLYTLKEDTVILDIVARIALGEVSPESLSDYKDIITLIAKAAMTVIPCKYSYDNICTNISPRNLNVLLERSRRYLDNILKPKS